MTTDRTQTSLAQQRHRTRQWSRELPITQCKSSTHMKKVVLLGIKKWYFSFSFQKKISKKQENKNKDNSKLSVFLLIEWLVCDTDSPWVIRQWMLSIISICCPSLSMVTLFMFTLLPQHMATSYPARLGNLKRWSHGMERSPRFSKTWEYQWKSRASATGRLTNILSILDRYVLHHWL